MIYVLRTNLFEVECVYFKLEKLLTCAQLKKLISELSSFFPSSYQSYGIVVIYWFFCSVLCFSIFQLAMS